MDHILFIHSSINGHVGCFHLPAVVNAAAVNVGVQGSPQDSAFNSSGHIHPEVELGVIWGGPAF